MKKYVILLLILFLPFMVNAATCDTDKIEIKSIDLVESSNAVVQNSDPFAQGKEIKVDVSMSNVGDNAKYKLIIKNDSDEDLEFNKDSININSQYLDYSFDISDNNIIKANSTKEIYLNIQYKKEVPDSAFNEGVFTNNQVMNVDLSNESVDVENPKTGISILLVVLLAVIVFSLTIIVITTNKKYSKLMVIIITLMMIIPVSVYALCKCSLKVDSRVRIEKNVQSFCIKAVSSDYSRIYYYPYERGMTWSDFINSNYNNISLGALVRDEEGVLSVQSGVCYNIVKLNNIPVSINDKIKNRHDGCYEEYESVC